MSDRRADRARLGWLWRAYGRPHLGVLLLALLLMAIEGSMVGLLSYMMEPMFDRVFLQGSHSAMWFVALSIFGIFLLRAATSTGQRVLMVGLMEKLAASLRGDLLRHLMTLDGSFHQTHPPGYLMERVQGDVQSVAQHSRELVTGLGRDVLSLILLFSVAIGVDWKWTLVALIGVPLLSAPSALIQRYIRKKSVQVREIAGRMSLRLDEIFHGIIPIKLNRLEDYQSGRYTTLTGQLVRAATRNELGRAMMPGLIDVVTGIGFLGVLVYGGGEIMSGEKTIGQFMSFFTAMGLAFEPIRRLGNLSGGVQSLSASLQRIETLLDQRTEVSSPATPTPVPGQPGDLHLQDVVLRYGDTEVLRGLTLTAQAGQTTALVGASGAGKSTVFNLITRLIVPQSGQITLGDTPIEAFDLSDLRDLYSVVSQEALLFDDTIRENLLLGRQDVTEAQLQAALDAAYVSDFLPSQPQGLETPVGPRGSALSGGQRQRVAIARALLRDTPILLLDEATSALDAQSETLVQKALDTLTQNRTTLVIAHRLSTIRKADQIIVMDQGRVVETGTHEALLANDGPYARLHALQAAEQPQD